MTYPRTFLGLDLAEAHKRLYFPFPANMHEQHSFFKFWYLKEEAINIRLTEVFGVGGWDKTILNQEFIPEGEPVVELGKDSVLLRNYPFQWTIEEGKYFALKDDKKIPMRVVFDIPVVMTTGYMTTRLMIGENIIESRHHTVAGDVLTSLGKERGAQLLNTYKASDTDLLKRGARQLGVGLYLTQISTATKDEKSALESGEAGLGAWIAKYYGPTTVNEAKSRLVSDLSSKMDAKALADKIRELGIRGSDILYNYDSAIERLSA